MKRNGIVQVGSTYFYKDELVVAAAVIALAIIGMICVQVGRKMDVEVERQRQIEMADIANDQLVNKEVTK